jgi:hypothetical protein
VKGLLIGPLIVSVAPTVLDLARRRVFDREAPAAIVGEQPAGSR